MADPSEQNPPNADEELPVAQPESPEYAQAKLILPSLSIEELQKLRIDVQAEIDHPIREQIRQREEEEAARHMEERRIDALYAAWLPKYFARRDRKDEAWAEKHAKEPKYGSATESDYESSDGFEYDVEEVNTSDLDSDAVEDKRKMEAYHEGKLRRRFEYELANPKIFARTMNEGEPRRVDVRMICAKSDEEDTEEEEEDGEDSNEDSSSSSGTFPAPSDSDDSEQYEEEGWDTDEEDFW